MKGGSVSLIGEEEETVQAAAEKLTDRIGVLAGIGDVGIRKADHVLVVIPYGKANGTRTEHLLDRMKERKITVEGCILINADGRFLTNYYGRQKGKHTD